METIKIRLGYAGSNYSAIVTNLDEGDICIATGDTLEETKKNIESAYLFHIDDDDTYVYEYKISISAQFHNIIDKIKVFIQ